MTGDTPPAQPGPPATCAESADFQGAGHFAFVGVPGQKYAISVFTMNRHEDPHPARASVVAVAKQ